MTQNSDISNIDSQTTEISKEDVVRERMTNLPYNSIIWAIADLYEKRGTTQPVEKLWTHPEIFCFSREKENKKYHHSKKFNEINEGDFEMRCKLCEFKAKFFITSKSCNEMLEHAREAHSNIFGEIELSKRDKYCSFKSCKDKKY